MTPEVRAPERRAASRRPRRRPLGRVSIALGLTVFISLVGTTFATANWSAPTSTVNATASSGIAKTVFTGTDAFNDFIYKNPVTKIVPLVVKNDGTTPLTYTLTVTNIAQSDLASRVALSLWKSAGATCAATIPSVGTTVGQATVRKLNEIPELPAGALSAPAGTTFTLCAATTLTGTVADSQGRTVSPIFTMTGQIGTLWKSAVTAPSFTQSVYRVVNPTNVTCTTRSPTLLSAGTATLSWDAPANEGTVSYRILRNGVLFSDRTTRSITLNYDDVTSTAFLVQSREIGFGTTSVGVPMTVSRSPGVQGLLLVSAYCGT